MGVWIETVLVVIHLQLMVVTPYVGVWIETTKLFSSLIESTVTPYVGVWIETLTGRISPSAYCHTLRGCVD